MRVQVNLATRPFVELRPFFLRLRLLMGVLCLAGLALFLGAHVLSARATRQQAELDQLRNQTVASQQVRLHTEQRMRQPANAAVLDRAHFLNALFLRKSFSWTAVMMDLENVLPTGVLVTSIEPQVTTDGQVVIRLRVAGERDRAVQLVRNLERSRRFLQPRLGSESAQNRENGGANGARTQPEAPGAGPAGPAGVEFEILAIYNPLPASEPYTVGRGRAAATGSDVVAPTGIQPRRTISNPSAAANLRAGYPADGVVLPHVSGTASRPASGTIPTRGGSAR